MVKKKIKKCDGNCIECPNSGTENCVMLTKKVKRKKKVIKKIIGK